MRVASNCMPAAEKTIRYRHNRTGENNGDAHLKRQVMGREVVVVVWGVIRTISTNATLELIEADMDYPNEVTA